MIDRLLMKLRLRDAVDAEEEEQLRSLPLERMRIARHRTVIRAGEEVTRSLILLEGLVARYKDLRGGGRQISAIHVPGDFLDLHGFTLKRLDDSIVAMTPCEFAVVPHKRIESLTLSCPHLTRLLWFSTNLDAAIHREWILSLGRRTALQRTAHFFCELWVRYDVVGMARPDGFAFSLTQTELAECLGLTPVHVNRTLKTLRENGIASYRGGFVEIPDHGALRQAAEFDETYLELERRHR